MKVLRDADAIRDNGRSKPLPNDPRIIPGCTTGSMEKDAQLAAMAAQQNESAKAMQAAVQFLSSMNIRITTDLPMFTAEVMKDLGREARRH